MTQNEACLLSCEDEQAFAEFRRSLDEAHQPANMHEHFLVEEFAQAAWELRRVRRIDSEFWQYIGGHYNRGETGIAEALAQEKESKFRIHLRLRAQAERSYYRALDALERMHRNRGRTVREIAATSDPAAACSVSPLACTDPQSSATATLSASAAPAQAPRLQVMPPRTSTGTGNPALTAAEPHAARPRAPTDEPGNPHHLDTIRYCPSRETA